LQGFQNLVCIIEKTKSEFEKARIFYALYRVFFKKIDVFSLTIGYEKGRTDVHPFCPKSTINLTYLCYGETNICLHYFKY